MTKTIIPEGYKTDLSYMESQRAIKKIKDFFQKELAHGLNLKRVSAPLFVRPESGLNDNLNGVERTVDFSVKDMDEAKVEVVQSLAKWKRMALKKYGLDIGQGIYTDMNAIRRDEELDNLHSIYVDQWDWEKIIAKKDRNKDYLRGEVSKIYALLRALGEYIGWEFEEIEHDMPDEIYFITTQELEDMYPDLSPAEREDAIVKEKKAVFLEEIGGTLKSGIKHDGRAPDYDDWELNGDILLWNEVLDMAYEISSMGIRVDEEALARQLNEAKAEDRAKLPFHKDILERNLPYTIGGGIGQSRLAMYFLKMAHIGEVQASVWPDEMIEECQAKGIKLL